MTKPQGIMYREAVAELRHRQKPSSGIPAYLRWVNRPLGRRLAAAAYVLRLRPNHVTALSMACSLIAMATLVWSSGDGLWIPLVTGLLLLAYALDSADGQLARLSATGSHAGEWLDHVADAIRQPATHMALAAYFYRHGDVPSVEWPVVVAGLFMILSSAWFFSQILAEKLSVHDQRSQESTTSAWDSALKTIYDPSFLYLGLLLLLVSQGAFVWFYVTLFAVHALIATLSGYRKYATLSRK